MAEQTYHHSELNHEETARFILDLFHRTMIHHALWFSEVIHQLGLEKGLDILHAAAKRSYDIQMHHLASTFGFELKDGIPAPLLDMDKTSLNFLKDRVAKNWLANDGVWFQAVEFTEGMNDAKRCNDSCWARFSPFEASSIKKFLELPDLPGLDGLKRALGFRVYAGINKQSIVDETEDSFIFRMDECRVQVARKRKGLADYPCKSGGLVEYSYFARTIDPRITTTCVGCPPDAHPDEWYCSWKFSLPRISQEHCAT
jgi:Family of unknown function (DUF6125)